METNPIKTNLLNPRVAPMGCGPSDPIPYPTTRLTLPWRATDEGGEANMAMVSLLRHHQTKGVGTDRRDLRRWQPALYATFFFLRQPIMPKPANADAKSGKAAGMGTTLTPTPMPMP